ncbi:hypothetical protein J6590_027084 [Homalodisca vitripennis]|nr:hypothetical protein J6590_027084 [Homalodisca vitripennis]
MTRQCLSGRLDDLSPRLALGLSPTPTPRTVLDILVIYGSPSLSFLHSTLSCNTSFLERVHMPKQLGEVNFQWTEASYLQIAYQTPQLNHRSFGNSETEKIQRMFQIRSILPGDHRSQSGNHHPSPSD